LLGPIFNREWLTVPRRLGHYFNRAAYLGLLWVLGLAAWQMTVGWTHTASLGEAARFGVLLFQIVAFVQLTLLVFFAALAAVSTITLEKDRRTFILLLLTDLRDYEIVLGKLVGSLLQIGTLVIATIPVLAMLLLVGGVGPSQLAQAVVLIAAAVLAAGSLGGLVALWRDRTFPALALTVLFLVLYLSLTLDPPAFLALLVPAAAALLVWGYVSRRERFRKQFVGIAVALGVLAVAGAVPLWWWLSGWPPLAAVDPVARAWLHPFVALEQAVNPPVGEAAPAVPAAYGCAAVMLLLSVILNGWGILWLRVWNPSGEPIMQRESPEDAEAEEKDRLKAHAAPGTLRQVWANPILWREIATRAYGRRPFLVKAAYFLVLGLVSYYALAPVWAGEAGGIGTVLVGLVLPGVLSLLLVSAQAVTAITSERDTGALDLLLVTDLTPREFIFGKVLGICWNTKEYLLPPLVLAVVYGCLGLLASPPWAHPEQATSKNVDALLCAVGASVVLLAFALVLGIHVALRTQNSRLAIVNALGTIFFLSIGTGVCFALIFINSRQFEYQWASFVLFAVAGIGGLWWVLSGERPAAALTVASFLCPLAVFYCVTDRLLNRPAPGATGDTLTPFLVIAGAFGFTVAAMLIPLVSEFDVALGRTSGGAD
jgi:ABC-type transport system involved in multi-copper enzyme maturation permease subunit